MTASRRAALVDSIDDTDTDAKLEESLAELSGALIVAADVVEAESEVEKVEEESELNEAAKLLESNVEDGISADDVEDGVSEAFTEEKISTVEVGKSTSADKGELRESVEAGISDGVLETSIIVEVSDTVIHDVEFMLGDPDSRLSDEDTSVAEADIVSDIVEVMFMLGVGVASSRRLSEEADDVVLFRMLLESTVAKGISEVMVAVSLIVRRASVVEMGTSVALATGISVVESGTSVVFAIGTSDVERGMSVVFEVDRSVGKAGISVVFVVAASVARGTSVIFEIGRSVAEAGTSVVFVIGASVASAGTSVVFETGRSVVETGRLVDESELATVEELINELETDVWHLKEMSEASGIKFFAGGRVAVHSFSSLMFFTPSRERRRYARA
jgi:hypothetical protein